MRKRYVWQVWSEACEVGISLVLDLLEQESVALRRHSALRLQEDANVGALCAPRKVLVWPKQIRRGI